MSSICKINWENHLISKACKEDNCARYHCEHHRYELCTCEQRCMICNDPKKKDPTDPYDHQRPGCYYGQADGPDDFNKDCDCDEGWFAQ